MARIITMVTPDGGKSTITTERRSDGSIALIFVRPGSPTHGVFVSRSIAQRLVEDLQAELADGVGD